MHAIEVEGLTKHYGKTKALDGLDLAARPGTVLGLLGPNGSGKTTTVRSLTTLLKPDSGRARVGGFDVLTQPQEVRRRIGLTGQYAAVDEELTGQQNLELIGRLLNAPRADARRRAVGLLERFDLADAAHRLVKTYSGGMQRRLDLAASLVGRPEVLFLDEPTTGLDPRSRATVWDLVRGMVADGVTVLLTTQYLEEADRVAHDLAVVDHGRVIATGTPDELKARMGGQSIEVRLADPADTDRAVRLVAEVSSAEPLVKDEVGLISVPGRDPALIRELSRRLDEAGIDFTELSLRRASLDEVFLALTGRDTADRAPVTDPAARIQERTLA